MKQQVFLTAWAMKKQNQFLTFGYCLKTAWAVCKLQASMKTGKVEFTFQKTDGETRRAVGTLDGSLFSYERKTAAADREPSPCQIKYFDLEKMAFRSFRAERFLGLAA